MVQKVAQSGFCDIKLPSSTDEKTRLNPSARSLRFVKMRSTKVKAGGVRALMEHAPSLEGVRCSNYDVLQVNAQIWKHCSFFKDCCSEFWILGLK